MNKKMEYDNDVFEEMNNSETIWNMSSVVGIVALVIYFILLIFQPSKYILSLRVIFICMATGAYFIKLGTEIDNNKHIVNSICLIIICLLDLVITAIQL